MIEACRTRMERWKLIRRQSVNWKVFSAMITVGGFNLVVSIAAIGKELVIAHQFGTSDAMDAFLIAFLLPLLAINVLSGSFHVAFIPEYIRIREQQGEGQAKRFFCNILSLYLTLLIVFSLLLVAISRFIIPILGAGFGTEKLALSFSLFLILIPILVMRGLIKAWGSVLNAGERFALTSISPVILHTVTLVILLVFGKMWGIRTLALGVVAGSVLEGALLIWGLKSKGYSILPRWYGLDAPMRRVIDQYMPVVLGTSLMGSMIFVDQTMAATIGSGSVSALSYGSKVVLFIAGLGSMALSTAIFPHFSKMVASEDWKNIHHTLWTYTRLILWVTIPLTLLLVYFSEPIVEFVFERGVFVKSDTHLVGKVQALYFFQMPFYVLGIMGVRLLSALKKNHLLMVIGAVNLLINIIGNYILIRYFGIAGISLSTSIVYAISTGLIFIFLSKVLKQKERLLVV